MEIMPPCLNILIPSASPLPSTSAAPLPSIPTTITPVSPPTAAQPVASNATGKSHLGGV